MSDFTYYDILGIKKSCTDSEVKIAYREAAFKWHPEKHSRQEKELAEKKFAEIAEAYTVLSDSTF
jgi:DnaJ-class molecular chaperone